MRTSEDYSLLDLSDVAFLSTTWQGRLTCLPMMNQKVVDSTAQLPPLESMSRVASTAIQQQSARAVTGPVATTWT